MAQIKAPWTHEQVLALNRWQKNESVHPFTCRDRGSKQFVHCDGEGVLVAMESGWKCPYCPYTQDWAHDFMLKEPIPLIVSPPNRILRIDEMFAFVSKDDKGNEGICGFTTLDGMWLPMVGADMARIESLRPKAIDLAKHAGMIIKLVKFSTRTELETYSGGTN